MDPDWATHQMSAAADAVGVDLDIKGGRHYTVRQLLAAGFDRRNTAARLGHSGVGATTLRHYADPVPEAGRRAATYLSRLTSTPPQRPRRVDNSSSSHPGVRTLLAELAVLYRAQSDLLPSCAILRSRRRRCAAPLARRRSRTLTRHAALQVATVFLAFRLSSSQAPRQGRPS